MQALLSSLQWLVAEGHADGQRRTRYVHFTQFSFPKDTLLADGVYLLFEDTLLSTSLEKTSLQPWLYCQRGPEIRFPMISSAETRPAATALPEEAGSAFKLLLHF